MNAIDEVWARLEAKMNAERMETHRTRTIFAGALYAASAAIACGSGARDLAEAAERIDPEGFK